MCLSFGDWDKAKELIKTTGNGATTVVGMYGGTGVGRAIGPGAGFGNSIGSAPAAISGIRKTRAWGKIGEEAAGVSRTRVGITIPSSGKTRFPDFVDNVVLKEVKNVNYQSLTQQLKDYLEFAKSRNLTFELWTRPNTRLSGPLRQKINSKEIIHRGDWGVNKRPAPITAAELQARLEQDPEHRAFMRQHEADIAAKRAFFRKDEAQLLVELVRVNWQVDSVWNFVNHRADDYQDAFPVLLKHLWLPHHPGTTEGIVRALTVKSARGEVAKHIVAWAKMRPDLAVAELAFPIWNCLNVVADKSMADDIIVLRDDPRFASETERFDKLITKLTRKRPSRASRSHPNRHRDKQRSTL